MIAALFGREAESGERVFQQGQQRQRRVIGGRRAGQQTQQQGRWGVQQLFAGTVIGGDAEAFQRSGDAGGEAAIWRDQRRGAARHFQRIAENHGNRGGVLRFVLRLQPGEPLDVERHFMLPIAELRRRQQGAGEQASTPLIGFGRRPGKAHNIAPHGADGGQRGTDAGFSLRVAVIQRLPGRIQGEFGIIAGEGVKEAALQAGHQYTGPRSGTVPDCLPAPPARRGARAGVSAQAALCASISPTSRAAGLVCPSEARIAGQ